MDVSPQRTSTRYWLAAGLFPRFGKPRAAREGHDHSRRSDGFGSLSRGVGVGVGENANHNFILDDGMSGRSKSVSSHEAGSLSDSKCVNTVTLGIAWRMSASMLSSRR